MRRQSGRPAPGGREGERGVRGPSIIWRSKTLAYRHLLTFLLLGLMGAALFLGAGVFGASVFCASAWAQTARDAPAYGARWSGKALAQNAEPASSEPFDNRPAPTEFIDPDTGNFLPDVAPDAEPEAEPFVDPETWYLQEDSARRSPPAATAPPPREEEAVSDVPPLPERKNLALAPAAPNGGASGGGSVAGSSPAPSSSGGLALPTQLTGTLSRMIGQMLIVGFTGTTPDEPATQRLAGQIHAGLVGGVIFMEHNIKSSGQVSRLAALFHEASRETSKSAQLPLLVAVDQEGGGVQRLAREKGFGSYPSAEELGRGNDPHKAYLTYKDMADELVANGFNFNLGPVVDLNRNANSPTIAGKARSYSADPQRVIAYAKAFCFAHKDAGVLTALKHFPGHGSAAGDSHVDLVDLSPTWTDAELDPYRIMVRDKVGDAVMVGHVYHPEFSDGKKIPASLSAMAIQRQLRGKLGYGGVVITDDLDMAAIRKNYGFDEGLTRAVEAGSDILLLASAREGSGDLVEKAVLAIRQAVASGRLSEERIRASYEKVMSLKRRLMKMEKERSRRQQVVASAPLTTSPPIRVTAPATTQPSSPASAATPVAGAPGGGVAPQQPQAQQSPPANSAAAARAARREREMRRDDFPF
jgi:beta-N-acetylhexosaminidase